MNILHGYSHVLTFGKYKDKTLQWCLTNDPSYIIWLSQNIPNFIVKPELLTKAQLAVPNFDNRL